VLSTLHIAYDVNLETELVKAVLPEDSAGALLDWIKSLREKITQNRLRRVASTRLLVNAVAALKAGRDMAAVQARYFQDWSADEKAKVSE
jgi:hypothetical protein